ncbi:winged helix-turn-helix domain-containing protein [Aneurinibacillus thermoaerophilus]|uniref:helix-turn-helix domain-containing protein n=1 Tax=Aneurinibacillus thermoaerophilus TaxID=143495 RepID=UPI002E1E8399|nr:winged helix-turn-helix domain-containing protein [Aneurinibacillus thermoaerophilus]MED0764367.1 winged helix-turn-helix domain-containing protein [Aneurinibacillus thermoaerophilus]
MGKLVVTQAHGFTPESLRVEERKMQDVLFKQRLMAVRLVMEGYSATEAGNILGICRQSVSTYVKMFNRSGLTELLHRDFPPGNKPYLSEEQHEELRRILLESTPKEEGIEPATSWDTRILQLFIQERFGVSMCRTGVLRMLYRMGFRYRRPGYQLAKANAEKQQAFIQQLDMIKKNC